jgi:hypothetical protein
VKRKRAEFYTCSGYKADNAGCRQCLPDPKIPHIYAHRGGWKCHNIGARVKNVPWPNASGQGREAYPAPHCSRKDGPE